MAKHVKVTIDEEGNAVVETLGYTGKECEEIMSQVTKAIGVVKETGDKPEKRAGVLRQDSQRI